MAIFHIVIFNTIAYIITLLVVKLYPTTIGNRLK